MIQFFIKILYYPFKIVLHAILFFFLHNVTALSFLAALL